MSGVIVDVTGRVARLYQDDPRMFVASRNELARDLVRAGQRELAQRIRALPRPQTSAWLVNQLYWHERGEYDALLAAGAAAREAQQARLQGGRGAELARALGERDAIITRLAAQAERLAAAGGVVLTSDTRQRMRTSLEAIALRAGDPHLPHGQLSADVPLPGLDALAGLVVRDAADPPARTPLTLVSEPPQRADQRRAREALEAEWRTTRAALDDLAQAHTTRRDEAEVADGALDAARLQVEAATRALSAAQAKLDQATAFEAAASARAAQAAAALADLDAQVAALTAQLGEIETQRDAITPARRAPRSR